MNKKMMKKMTNEEKAKAYDEALDRCKEWASGTCEQSISNSPKDIAEFIFPQLAESKDERIRKTILTKMRACQKQSNFFSNDEIAYLEKQGINTEGDFGRGYDCGYQAGCDYGYQAGYAVAKNEMKPKVATATLDSEKQKEQKPAEFSSSNDSSEYDKGYMDGKAFQLKQVEQYSIGKTFMGLIPCWVNAPSTRQPAHKYHGRNAVIMHENNGGFMCCFIDDEEATVAHLPDNTGFVEGWRKKPTEWSKEDNKNISVIKIALQNAKSKAPREYESSGKTVTYEEYEKAENWILKSLRPQPHWKPSKEQLDALRASNSYWKGTTSEVPRIDLLESLHDDLEKLIAKR